MLIRSLVLVSLLSIGGPALAVEPDPPTLAPPSDGDADAARKRAREVDLPALAEATHAVVRVVHGMKVTEYMMTGADLAAWRSALVVTDAQPSGGKNAARITFHQRGAVLGVVWMFADGEWGFEVKGATSWTLGVSTELAKLLAAL